MFQAIRSHGLSRTLTSETPVMIGSFVVAEMFYKFGSFSLECLAFLATWFVASWGLDVVTAAIRKTQP